MTPPRRCRLAARAVLLFPLAAVAAGAHAGSCAVTSQGLAFGGYQSIAFAGKLASGDVRTNASVTLVCTGITSAAGYTLALGPSPVNNSIAPRQMAHDGGGPPMNFDVYRDDAHTSIWGDGVTGSLVSGTIVTGDSTTTIGVHGRVPGGQYTLRPGSYSVSLPMTLSYEP